LRKRVTRLRDGYLLAGNQRHPEQSCSFVPLGNLRLSEPPLIAVVDDDEAVRDALCDLLQVAGLSARGFEGAGAFLDDYAPGRFELLITDVRVPHIDGFELLRRLRALETPPPAIVLTSLS